ncbi:acyltransferase family protein [Paraburkholderia silvatlantica]|uniref:acyltransferase family protein n=1 Tax=Paraburkholderia silvatlantica TaxID=321895 RepID=UPI001061C25C|nr:acyltransferase [Paraburkholderia silvatlantica]TDQ79007.1 peptidoglycan/LPS O-acetylase OafA/YrhL [Paraburkholderia silvatlantica]
MNKDSHLAVPDCLRGLAAISVLLFHFNHWLGIPWLAPNAGIAVDFFFGLSGYVLCVAYRGRFERGMSGALFARIRLIRLMPMIVIGTLLSASYLAARFVLLHDAGISPGWLTAATLLGLSCIPTFGAPHAIGGPQVFPLNGPEYTLFLELVVNLFWMLTRRFDGIKFALVVAISGYALTAVFGMGGDTPQTFLSGFPRVFGAYYLGVLLYHGDVKFGLLPLRIWKLLFLPACLATVVIMGWNGQIPFFVQWVWAAAVMPLLILGGSTVALTGPVRAAALVLGELSYPVYALHYPTFVWLNGIYQELMHRKDPILEAAVFLPAILLASYLIMRFVDTPIRAWLVSRFGRSTPKARLDTKAVDTPV